MSEWETFTAYAAATALGLGPTLVFLFVVAVLRYIAAHPIREPGKHARTAVNPPDSEEPK